MTVKHGPFSVSCHYMKTVLKLVIVSRGGHDSTVDHVFNEVSENTAENLTIFAFKTKLLIRLQFLI